MELSLIGSLFSGQCFHVCAALCALLLLYHFTNLFSAQIRQGHCVRSYALGRDCPRSLIRHQQKNQRKRRSGYEIKTFLETSISFATDPHRLIKTDYCRSSRIKQRVHVSTHFWRDGFSVKWATTEQCFFWTEYFEFGFERFWESFGLSRANRCYIISKNIEIYEGSGT